jgi:hypothetical protein
VKENRSVIHASTLEQRLADEAKGLSERSNCLTARTEKSCYARLGKTRWPHISVNGWPR